MKRWIFSVVVIFCLLSINAIAQGRYVAPRRNALRTVQTLTVSNFLQPEGLPARDALTALSGVPFADSSAFDLFGAPFTLNGVSVWVDDVPQPVRSVTPDQVVFILTRIGPQSVVKVRTQSGDEFSALLKGTGVWPGVLINGDSQSETGQNFIPLATWVRGQTASAVTNDPVPVGQQPETTKIILFGSGWRNAAPGQIRVRLNGIECKVLGFAAHPLWIGTDTVTFEVPPWLAGNGAMDVTVFMGNRESNFSRIILGDAIQ